MIELNRILCPVDFSAFSERACVYAARLAQKYNASLDVIHVLPPMPPSSTSALAASSRELSERNLMSLLARCELPGVDMAAEIVESADPVAKILDAAERHDADLIVTGSHGRSGMQRALLGSVVEALLHKSPCPMLTVPSHTDPQRIDRPAAISKIVCAVDFAGPSLAALAYSLALAEEADATLTLLHVVELPPELQSATRGAAYDVGMMRAEAEARSLTRLRALIPEHARDYCTVRTEVLVGRASPQILREAVATDADLIVLGVHGRNAFDLAFFGSNSKDVIRQARCPVLVVPVSRQISARAAS